MKLLGGLVLFSRRNQRHGHQIIPCRFTFRAFHMSFCRAVEATSVTPFAPRALDAMLAAAARHVEPALTPEAAAGTIAENPQAYAEVRFVVAAKMQVAGHDIQVIDRCLARLDAVRDAWADIADKQKRSGDDFAYAKEDPGRRLLQDPFSRRANN